jgi:hypothetical protein
MFFTIEPNGDVLVSIIRDAGKGAVPYARIHRVSRMIEIIGVLPEPKSL